MRIIKKIRWAEQIEHLSFTIPSATYRRWLKRVMRRARRRDGKLNGDMAVKKNRYYGWEY